MSFIDQFTQLLSAIFIFLMIALVVGFLVCFGILVKTLNNLMPKSMRKEVVKLMLGKHKSEESVYSRQARSGSGQGSAYSPSAVEFDYTTDSDSYCAEAQNHRQTRVSRV